jgi:hypothetical protein
MATILKMLRRFEVLNTDKIIEDVLVSSEGQMADLNAEQINQGLRADGTLMPDYSFRSVFQYGKTPGPMTLRDKGNWQAGLYARVDFSSNKITFSSTDGKNDMLTENYGVQITGLSEKFKAEVMRDKIRPGFKEKIFESTGLNMKR